MKGSLGTSYKDVLRLRSESCSGCNKRGKACAVFRSTKYLYFPLPQPFITLCSKGPALFKSRYSWSHSQTLGSQCGRWSHSPSDYAGSKWMLKFLTFWLNQSAGSKYNVNFEKKYEPLAAKQKTLYFHWSLYLCKIKHTTNSHSFFWFKLFWFTIAGLTRQLLNHY